MRARVKESVISMDRLIDGERGGGTGGWGWGGRGGQGEREKPSPPPHPPTRPSIHLSTHHSTQKANATAAKSPAQMRRPQKQQHARQLRRPQGVRARRGLTGACLDFADDGVEVVA